MRLGRASSLTKADPYYDERGTVGILRQVRATREVILSGGAFNSSQLLKFSGVGPPHELRDHGIDPVVDLPGIGENLQDSYEVGIVSKMTKDLALLKDCTWGADGDPCLRVVGVSVFPRIPGFFIVVPVYMVSEKTSDDIIVTAKGQAA
ncbi:GMC family oxidoreductase N-terminal domain-containing protein [Microbulbifer sp. GL-2]|uniref:GMC family oxidoreductase N-terminal domain-containing protein n=1 Tax=Microbulbifer sp. GL-2 TaxID=2591606 RepID=UPI0011650943|nr:GMC family oxidoreductase N-terminal domain-containing protein [Microbulbifer sp. GL-2]BBM03134.1 hypothetical protein GL2_32080 [Microbulbifer sp. GL-2]